MKRVIESIQEMDVKELEQLHKDTDSAYFGTMCSDCQLDKELQSDLYFVRLSIQSRLFELMAWPAS